MRALVFLAAVGLATLSATLCPAAVLFEDTFKTGLSMQWQAVNLDKKDYRVRDGGLEMRVQNGQFKKDTPMLKVVLPFQGSDSVTVSVKLTLLNDFTAENEFAGVYLIENGTEEFSAEKKRVNGKLVFSPGKYVFNGKKGHEGDVDKYDIQYTEAKNEAGPLRIIVDRGNAFFQVGPSDKGEFTGSFHSAIATKSKERGFCLAAAGAAEGAVHWVRFTDFRVEK